MQAFSRAKLHLERKWKKSLILLLVLTVISTLLLSTMLLAGGASAGIDDLQLRLMASFALQKDTTNGDLYHNEVIDALHDTHSMAGYYSGPVLDEELLSYVESVDGVSFSNWEKELYLNSFRLFDTTLVPGTNARDIASGDYAASRGLGGLTLADHLSGTQSTTFSMNTNTALNRYFTSGQFSLVQGRHLTDEDTFCVMISRDLAEQNGYVLGDTIPIAITQWEAVIDEQYESLTEQDYDRLSHEFLYGPYDLQIVGIYDVMLEARATDHGMEAEVFMPENQLLIDWNTGLLMQEDREDFVRSQGGQILYDDLYFEQMAFSVEDPSVLQDVMEHIKSERPETSLFSWQTNAGTYTASTAPLSWMRKLMLIASAIVILSGILILCLVIALWNRARRREAAVCIAIGVTKWGMLAQFLIEGFALAMCAVLLRILPSMGISSLMEENLLSQASVYSGQEELLQEDYNRYDYVTSFDTWKMFTTYRNMTPEDLSMDLSMQTLGILTCMMLLATFVSIVLANFNTWRLRPKELLTQIQ